MARWIPKLKPLRQAGSMKLANTYFEQRDYDKAIAEYEAVLKVFPQLIEARLRLGSAHLNLKHYAEADKAFRAVLEVDPDMAHVHLKLGDLHVAQGERAAAFEAYSAALRSRPLRSVPPMPPSDRLLSLRHRKASRQIGAPDRARERPLPIPERGERRREDDGVFRQRQHHHDELGDPLDG